MDILLLKVIRLVKEAKDTLTIFLERADGKPLNYQAGQFLTFLFSFHGRELRRSYSFSSTPGVDILPSITVKKVINGEVSRYLLDHLRAGDELRSLPPAGRFVLGNAWGAGPNAREDIRGSAAGATAGSEEAAGSEGVAESNPSGLGISGEFGGGRQLFFIAAGSGMAPVFSLLKYALVEKPLRRVVLISQQHDKENILFRKELEGLLEQYPGRFRWVNILSTPGLLYGDGSGGKERAGRSFYGRLTNLLLEDLLEELSGEEPEEYKAEDPQENKKEEWKKELFYLCGPPAFMRMVQFTLRLMGVADAQIRKENFTVEFVPPPPPLTDDSPKQVTIHHEGQTAVFDIIYPTTLLQAALDHGIALPYSCRGGRCSSCTVRCLKGRVKMSINDVLTDKDLQERLVLTCVGYAATDVELAY